MWKNNIKNWYTNSWANERQQGHEMKWDQRRMSVSVREKLGKVTYVVLELDGTYH